MARHDSFHARFADAGGLIISLDECSTAAAQLWVGPELGEKRRMLLTPEQADFLIAKLQEWRAGVAS